MRTIWGVVWVFSVLISSPFELETRPPDVKTWRLAVETWIPAVETWTGIKRPPEN